MPKTILPDVENAHIERALGLPQGTFDNQLGNDPVIDQLAKIVQTFPWMVDVADAGFDPITAKQLLVVAAAQQTVDRLEAQRPPKDPPPEDEL